MKLKLIIITIIALLSWSCSNDNEPSQTGNDPVITPAERIQLTESQGKIVESYNQFAVKLSDKVMAIESDNVVMSPMSVTMALSMVANGAKGETLDEITSLWGINGGDLDKLNELNRRFLDILPTIDPNAEFIPANSLWINSSSNSILSSYSESMQSLYEAEVYCNPFSSVKDKVNTWIEEKTDGMIKDMLEHTPEGDVLLANALYFHAPWTGLFDKSLTKKRDFHNADGTSVKTDMMDGGDKQYDGRIYENAIFVTVPYGNNAFRMRILMPADHMTPAEAFGLLADYDAQHVSTSKVKLRMPRFEVESEVKGLADHLRDMGVRKMIECAGDFSPMSPLVKGFNLILHNTKIKADEEGMKAASATVVELITSPGFQVDIIPELVTIDHPFFFTIEECSTGLILFTGSVRNL